MFQNEGLSTSRVPLYFLVSRTSFCINGQSVDFISRTSRFPPRPRRRRVSAKIGPFAGIACSAGGSQVTQVETEQPRARKGNPPKKQKEISENLHNFEPNSDIFGLRVPSQAGRKGGACIAGGTKAAHVANRPIPARRSQFPPNFESFLPVK